LQALRRTGWESQDLGKDSVSSGLQGDDGCRSSDDGAGHPDNGSSGTCFSPRMARSIRYGRAPQNAGWYSPNSAGGGGGGGSVGGTAAGVKRNGENNDSTELLRSGSAVLADGMSGDAEENAAPGCRGFGITGS